MRAIIADESYKAGWDKAVYTYPGAISWHFYDWYKMIAAHHPVKYYPIAACEGDDVVGVLPLYRLKTMRGGEMLISIPYFVAGGIVAGSAEAKAVILDKAIEISKELGSLPIILKQYSIPVESDSLVTDTSYFNLELNLSVGVEKVYNDLDERNKQQIRDSEKWNLVFEYPSSDIKGYYRILVDHHHRAGIPYPSRGWVNSLIADTYDIALLKLDGKIVAATLAKKFKDSISFPLTALGSDSEESMTFAYRLYWELLKRQIEDGVRIFHSGRIPNNNDVPAYRLGWGGEHHGYYYQYFGYGGKTESENKGGEGRGRFETLWKKVPKPITSLVNPYLVRQFP
jgi:hypothetical protein